MLAQIVCLWQVNDIYCFLWSIFAERNRSCSRVSLFSKQFTACLFVRLNILSVDVSQRREEAVTTRMQLSLFVVFLIWLRFLVDFRFADFRLIRISALPVFHISRFLDLPFTCQPVSRATKAFKKGVLYHGENCNRGPKNYSRILQPTLLLVNRWPYLTHLLGRLQPRSQGSLLPALRSERERDPGKRWSRVSQNLGDYKQTIWGRGR